MTSEENSNGEKPQGEGLPASALATIDTGVGQPPPPEERRAKRGSQESPLYIRDPDSGKWTRGLVFWTAGLVVVAVLSAGISLLQWDQLRRASIQAEGQLRVMEAGQRPWIKIDVVPGALKFNPQSSDATFQYGFRIKNVGNSVAVGVRVDAKIIAPPFDAKPFNDVAAAQESFCSATIANKATENEDRNHMGINLFPNESFPTAQSDAFGGNYGGSSNVSKAEMLSAEPQPPTTQPLMREHLEGLFAPYLIGCVTYQLSVTPGRHQTGFIYDIHRVDPSIGLNVPLFIKMDNDLLPPNIVFEKWFFGAGKID